MLTPTVQFLPLVLSHPLQLEKSLPLAVLGAVRVVEMLLVDVFE